MDKFKADLFEGKVPGFKKQENELSESEEEELDKLDQELQDEIIAETSRDERLGSFKFNVRAG